MAVEIKIFVDGKERILGDALKQLSDINIMKGIYCDQTVIDLRDAIQYLKGRCDVIERMYMYTVKPPANISEVDELMRLKDWFSHQQ